MVLSFSAYFFIFGFLPLEILILFLGHLSYFFFFFYISPIVDASWIEEIRSRD